MTTRMKPQPCTGCGYVVDAVTGLESEWEPRPGDYNLCMNCGHLSVFVVSEEGLALGEATPEEVEEAMSAPETRTLVSDIRMRRATVAANAR